MLPVIMIETIYPCWTYALRRIGRSDLLNMQWLDDKMPELLVPYKGVAGQGDLAVWQNEEASSIHKPVVITKTGMIISRRLKYNYHAAVCEGNGLVSDMVAPDDADIPFEIRIRPLSEIRKPDFIIESSKLDRN